MPSFIRRKNRKGAKGAAPPTSSNPSKSSNNKRTKPEKKTQENQDSPRGVNEDDSSISDVSSSEDGSSLRSEESSCDESSYDGETDSYADNAPKVFVDMIKHVFSGSDDDESLSVSHAGDGDSTTKVNPYSKQCYRLGLNDGNLVEMDIECGLMGIDDAKEMMDVLPSNSRLQKLCIGCCSSDKKQRQIFRMLLSGLAGNSSVSELVIRGAAPVKTEEGANDEAFYLNRVAASLLSTTLAKNQSVQTICLKKCRFIDSALAILFMGMQHSRIKDISIISSSLSDSNADIVSASLPLMELTSLSIVDASLTTNGLRFLCDNIKKNASLTKLNLSRNALGCEGTTLLTKSIKSPKHCKLTALYLSSCSIDDASIHLLVKPLKAIPSLSTIDLSQNEFGDLGALQLKGLLEKNNAITELRVDGNKITTRKRLAAIAEALRYNNSVLKTFGFSATTSMAIFNTVDALEEMGGQIGASVSEAVINT